MGVHEVIPVRLLYVFQLHTYRPKLLRVFSLRQVPEGTALIELTDLNEGILNECGKFLMQCVVVSENLLTEIN